MIVTGSAGFIGSALMRRLPDAFGIDRTTGPSIQQTTDLPGSCEVIYHLASPVGPVGVLDWAGRLLPEVVECAEIVRGWAVMYGCPLVFVSTSEVYGSGVESYETDDCHFAPENTARQEYAIAKLAAEVMLRNTPGLDVRIARPFNVAGPGQQPVGGFVLPRFIDQALAGEPLTVYAPGTQLRAFTHVDDVVDGLLLIAEKGKPGEVYNLGNRANLCSIAQLADEVIEATGSRSEVAIVDPVTLHGPAFREAREKFPNGAKAARDLGWTPYRDRAQIIADAIMDRICEQVNARIEAMVA